MAYVEHELAAVIRVDPARAAETMLDAYKATGCNAKEAARKFSFTQQTWIRYVKRVDAALRKKGLTRLTPRLRMVKASAKKQGWHHHNLGGRPTGSGGDGGKGDGSEREDGGPVPRGGGGERTRGRGGGGGASAGRR